MRISSLRISGDQPGHRREVRADTLQDGVSHSRPGNRCRGSVLLRCRHRDGYRVSLAQLAATFACFRRSNSLVAMGTVSGPAGSDHSYDVAGQNMERGFSDGCQDHYCANPQWLSACLVEQMAWAV